MTTTVTTQDELDAAIEAGEGRIIIDSPADFWLKVRGSSSVVARGSSHVEARGSSSVVARDTSRVEASESSRVEAWESSRVEAWESSHVVASPYVAVHLLSAAATVTGGVIIDLAGLDLTDVRTWCDYHGVTVNGDTATVYKAVSLDYMAGQGHVPTRYDIGATVIAADWDPTPECGRGLHFSPTPRAALCYYQGDESDGEPAHGMG